MTDVMTRLAAANPVASEDETSSGELTAVLERVRVAPARAPRRRAQPRLVGGGVALAGTAGAAAVGVLVLSAGTGTPPAEAFPILRGPATDISRLVHVHAATDPGLGGLAGFSTPAFVAALQDAHSFAVPDVAGESGYVVESPDASTLCLMLARQVQTTTPPLGEITLGPVACSATSAAEQDGFATSAQSGGENVFAAIVPAGATVSLTDDRTTTAVSVSDGIATGAVTDMATLTIDVAGTSTSYSIPTTAQNSGEVWWVTRSSDGSTGPTASSAPIGASSTTGTTGTTASSAPIGASGTTGTTDPAN
jgi:hypothetical protein